MSDHIVEVVEVHKLPHPNADSLSLVKVHGFTAAVRSCDWEDGQLGAYIPPDSIVPDLPEYEFLGGHRRIKVKKMRGVPSMGLLVPAPPGLAVGDDAAEALGIVHYEPPVKEFNRVKINTSAEPAPDGYFPHYDVENLRRYENVLVPGEMVVATEKIHGANCRFTYVGGRLYCGSRNEWKLYNPNSAWWRIAEDQRYAGLGELLRDFPTLTVYGEVYGCIQDLRYGHKDGDISLAAFDIWVQPREEGDADPHWMPYGLFTFATKSYDIPAVPQVHVGAYDKDMFSGLAEGPSLIQGADHLREGVVVKPLVERYDPVIGRAQLKLVSSDYLERSK